MKRIVVLQPLHSRAIANATLKSGQRLIIGRTSESDYAVPFDGFMSGMHFELDYHGTEIRIKDLQSRNGTWVNDTRIRSARLAAGDQITAGMTVFAVHLVDEDAAATNGRLQVVRPRKIRMLHGLMPFRRTQSEEYEMTKDRFDLD